MQDQRFDACERHLAEANAVAPVLSPPYNILLDVFAIKVEANDVAMRHANACSDQKLTRSSSTYQFFAFFFAHVPDKPSLWPTPGGERFVVNLDVVIYECLPSVIIKNNSLKWFDLDNVILQENIAIMLVFACVVGKRVDVLFSNCYLRCRSFSQFNLFGNTVGSYMLRSLLLAIVEYKAESSKKKNAANTNAADKRANFTWG